MRNIHCSAARGLGLRRLSVLKTGLFAGAVAMSVAGAMPAAGATLSYGGTLTQDTSVVEQYSRAVLPFFPHSGTESTSDNPSPKALALPKFDASIGTLNSVDWVITASLNLAINTNAVCIPTTVLGTCTTTAKNTFTLTTDFFNEASKAATPLGISGNTVLTTSLENGNAIGCIVRSAIGSDDCFENTSTSVANDVTTYTDTDVANYVDDGTPIVTVPGRDADKVYVVLDTLLALSIEGTCRSGLAIGSVCLADANGTASVSVTAELTYNYTPNDVSVVPLPAGLGLLATGLIGLGGMSLRRRRQQSDLPNSK